VEVNKGNSAASTFAEKNGASQTFGVNPGIKIEANGEEATLADIRVGDAVMVQAKAEASETSTIARQL
jgi:hypothetical protein